MQAYKARYRRNHKGNWEKREEKEGRVDGEGSGVFTG